MTTTGTSNRTLVMDGGLLVQTYPRLPVGCACVAQQDPTGCVPEYYVEGIGSVVPLAAYEALRARSWRWRIHTRWTHFKWDWQANHPNRVARGEWSRSRDSDA